MFRKTLLLKVSGKSKKDIFSSAPLRKFELSNLPSINILKTVSTTNVSYEFSPKFLKLLRVRLFWNHFCQVSACSGTTLVTGEMSAFYIFMKTSVTCIGMLREVALLH